jgi:hypothetical protein
MAFIGMDTQQIRNAMITARVLLFILELQDKGMVEIVVGVLSGLLTCQSSPQANTAFNHIFASPGLRYSGIRIENL